MAKRPVHSASVEKSELITPHLRRIVLRSESFRELPESAEGGYMKLLLPREGREAASDRPLAEIDLGNYWKRSYTIREVSGDLMTLDFVLHKIGGPAAAWAKTAAPGSSVLVTGPGPVKMLQPQADWFLLAGDQTGLPAIAVNLRKLPPDAVGYCVVETGSEQDRQELQGPAGVEVQWLVVDSPGTALLVDAVRALSWRQGAVGVWTASEYSAMKGLRAYFKERAVDPSRMYVSSYWKLDATDEEHKQAKKVDA